MAESRWPAIVDALVTRLRATTGFQAPTGTTSDVRVYDGSEVEYYQDDVTSYVVIGLPTGGPGEGQSGSERQSAGPMASTRPRDAEGVIHCRAVGQPGDVDPSQARTLAFAAKAAVSTALRSPSDGPTLGLSTPRLVVQMSDGAIRQYLTAGSVCEIDFDVTYETRI